MTAMISLRSRPTSPEQPRSPIPKAIPLALVAVGAVALVAAAVLVFRPSGGSSDSGGVPHAKGLDGILQDPALPKPNFTLTDTEGQPFNLQTQTAGYVTLLYFGYTHCPDICPTQMANIALGLKHESASVRSHIKMVFVTTDPHRDTPQVLRQWLDNFDPSFIGLTGTDQQITAAEASVGMPPAEVEPLGNGNYSVDHAAWVLAFTLDNQAHAIYPSGFDTAAVWAHDLSRLVTWRAS